MLELYIKRIVRIVCKYLIIYTLLFKSQTIINYVINIKNHLPRFENDELNKQGKELYLEQRSTFRATGVGQKGKRYEA